MQEDRIPRNGLLILTAVLTITVVSQNCLGLGIGSHLSSNNAQWEWGPDYLPHDRTTVRFTVNAFSHDLDYISVLWPFVQASGGDWLDCALVEVNGEPVSQVEPYYAMPPRDYDFTWDVKPKSGYTWPTESFLLMAGAQGSGGPDGWTGGSGIPAIGAGFKFNSPYDYFSKNEYFSGAITNRQFEIDDTTPWYAPFRVVGRSGYHWNEISGMWIHAGETIVFESDSSNEFTGDGLSGNESFRMLSDVPTMALVAGILDTNGNWTLVQSQGNSDGFVGGGKKAIVAPTTGFIGYTLNYQYNAKTGPTGPYCTAPDYLLDVTVRVEPRSLGTYGVSGTQQIVWSGENESLAIDFDQVGSGNITIQKLRRDDPLLPDGLPDGVVWELLSSEGFSFEDGSAVLAFEYDESLLPEGFNEADILVWHWNGQEWQDVTAFLDTQANTITTTELTSFSPFVVVPEPTTLGLLAAGGVALLVGRRRHQCPRQ